MTYDSPTLGTLLRRLIELLDGDLEAVYRAQSLDWRPKYTPMLRALLAGEPLSIGALADRADVSQPAASQTLRDMAARGLVRIGRGADGRSREVRLTGRTRAMVPALQAQWRATNAAAERLEAEIGAPLGDAAARAIDALERKSFAARICEEAGREAAPC